MYILNREDIAYLHINKEDITYLQINLSPYYLAHLVFSNENIPEEITYLQN